MSAEEILVSLICLYLGYVVIAAIIGSHKPHPPADKSMPTAKNDPE